MKSQIAFAILVLGLVISFEGCRPKDEIITNASGLHLNFYGDTNNNEILFDTVFTGQVTITRRLVVYNPYSNAINISQISLASQGSSGYSIIINGLKQNAVYNLVLLGKDSMYILITATINRKNALHPFLVQDSIAFITMGNSQKIILTAWGRDAHYFNGDTLSGTIVWDSSDVKFINRTILVPLGSTLTISKGTQIKARRGQGLIIEGKIIVEGDSNKKVTFDGPSLDKYLSNEAGQWSGILIKPNSVGNKIDWAVIKNAETGITIGNDQNIGSSDLLLSNTILENFSNSGLEMYNAHLIMFNCLVTNCLNYGVEALLGGNYTFFNNTIANYSSLFQRTGISLFVSDTKYQDKSVSNPIQVNLTNNIVWGDQVTEFNLDDRASSKWTSSVILRNILQTTDSTQTDTTNIYSDPGFVNAPYSFYLTSTSPGIGKGLNINLFNNDLKGKDRGIKFDIGAYQF